LDASGRAEKGLAVACGKKTAGAARLKGLTQFVCSHDNEKWASVPHFARNNQCGQETYAKLRRAGTTVTLSYTCGLGPIPGGDGVLEAAWR
jgi:hypothetical protein